MLLPAVRASRNREGGRRAFSQTGSHLPSRPVTTDVAANSHGHAVDQPGSPSELVLALAFGATVHRDPFSMFGECGSETGSRHFNGRPEKAPRRSRGIMACRRLSAIRRAVRVERGAIPRPRVHTS